MSGHHLLRDGRTVYDLAGAFIGRTSRYAVGCAKCTCGDLSPKGISVVAAWQWFHHHKRGCCMTEDAVVEAEHEHQWVDVSTYADGDRREMCTVPECGEQRTVQR